MKSSAKINAVITDVVFGYLVYAGLYQGAEIQANLALFVVWFFIVIGLLMGPISADKVKVAELAEKRGRPRSWVWRMYDALTDIAFVTAFAALGWFVTAAFLAAALMCKQGLSQAIDDRLGVTA